MPILIVSEENNHRASLFGYRLRAGQDVVSATTEDFRQLLKQQDFHVIVVDSQSMGSHILDVCEEIRAFSGQPLLLLTHDPSESFLLSAYAIGVDECVLRPVSAELLVAKVNAWMRWSLSTADARRTSEKCDADQFSTATSHFGRRE